MRGNIAYDQDYQHYESGFSKLQRGLDDFTKNQVADDDDEDEEDKKEEGVDDN